MAKRKEPHPFRVEVWGKPWKVIRGGATIPPDLVGLCCYETKTITIRPQTSPRKECETLIHEMIHALFPDASEKKTISASASIMEALSKWGLRFERVPRDKVKSK